MEFKPCPFCGCENIQTNELKTIASCPKCYCFEFIHCWNIRPIEEALEKRIKELEQVIELRNLGI